MPFKSEAQRRYLWMFHPDVARKWADEAKTEDEEPPLMEKEKKDDSRRKPNNKPRHAGK